MKRAGVEVGKYFHISNTAIGSEKIFRDRDDFIKFLFLILHHQSPACFSHSSRKIREFASKNYFNISEFKMKEILAHRYVDLVAYVILPSEFHLTLLARNTRGISTYLQRIQNAYAKYFNTKYHRRGHVFAGPYRQKKLASKRALLDSSTYIHKKPGELKNWKKTYHRYPWSSFQDFIGKNRFGNLLMNEEIIGNFSDGKKYKQFVANPNTNLPRRIGVGVK